MYLDCSRVFTIDVSGQRSPENFTNSGYVSTETTSKSIQQNDGLPTYEEAIGISQTTIVPSPVGQSNDLNQFTEVNERSHGRHRHGRRHRHRNGNNQRNNDGVEEEGQRRHRRRGFRRGRHSKAKRDQSEQ